MCKSVTIPKDGIFVYGQEEYEGGAVRQVEKRDVLTRVSFLDLEHDSLLVLGLKGQKVSQSTWM